MRNIVAVTIRSGRIISRKRALETLEKFTDPALCADTLTAFDHKDR